MQMNTDPAWLKKMAEREDGQIVSVGGLVSDIDASEPPTEEEAGHDCLFIEATDRLDIDPEADISDLRAQVPETEKANFQEALEGYAMVHFADSKGWIDWGRFTSTPTPPDRGAVREGKEEEGG